MTKARDLGNLVSLNSFFADGTIQAGEITGLAASATIDTTNASNITSGTIAAARLPSYVDDVLEYANLAALPGTGETGKIYVALDTNKVYRWSGSTYVEISPAPDLSGYLPLSGGTLTGNITLNSGTAGGVAYLNGSKVLTTGSALTFDGSTFGVTGAATVTGDISTTSTGRLNVRGSGTGINYDLQIDNSDTLVNFRASRSNAIIKSYAWYLDNSVTEAMRLTSTGLGIGTSSPSTKLDVIGTGLVSSFGSNTVAETYVQVKNGTSTLYLGGSSSYNYVYGTASVPLTFWTNSAERMRLDSSGNLGIGTSLPGARLNAVVSYVASTIVPSLKLSTVGGYNTGSGTAIDFGQDQGTYPTWVTGRVASPRTGSNWGGSLTFSTNDDSSATALVERARITSGGDLLVGTTVNHPSARIMVEGNIFANYNNTVALRYNVSGQTNGYYKGFTGTSIENGIARGLHIFNYDQDSNFGICFYPNNYAGQTANPAMTLNSTGNLLIGTTNQDVGGTVLGARITPSGKMLLATDNASGMFYDEPLYLDRRNNSGDGACIVLARNGYYKAAIGVVSNGLAAAGSMTFSTATNDGYTERMRITSGGGVGIGTTSPTRPLTIQAAGAAFPSTSNPSIRLDNTASGRFAVIESASDSNLYIVNGDADNASTIFRRGSGAGSESFRFGPAGQLGIAGANYGTSGQVLTSNGSGSAPSWQNAAGGGSAATSTALGTVYGKTDTSSLAFLGYQAGNSTSGGFNTAVGYQALFTNGSGTDNTVIGYQAAYTLNALSTQTVAIGFRALYSCSTGLRNMAIGYNAGYATTGDRNLFIGSQSGFSNTTGTGNTFVSGWDSNNWPAGYYNTTGSDNTALGGGALRANTTGSSNVAIGTDALHLNTTTSGHVAIGAGALKSLATGAVNSVAVGQNALTNFNPSSNATNTAVGTSALSACTTGAGNVALGRLALTALTTGQVNVAIGSEDGVGNWVAPLKSLTTGSSNVAIGPNALQALTTGGKNIGIGERAIQNATTPSHNIAIGCVGGSIGWGPLQNCTTGAANIAIGGEVLASMTTANYNTSIGYGSMVFTTTGFNNVALGTNALFYNTTGEANTAVGYQAGFNNTTGYWNTTNGYQSGYYITTGIQNTLIGAYNGNYVTQLTTGSYNIHLGTYCKVSSSSVDYEIVIGYNVYGKGANTAFIGGSNGAYQQNNSSSWSTTSDFRLKKNIVDNNEGLEKIAAIRVRNFEYRLPEEVTELPAHTAIKKAGVQLGVIAQELQQVCPDCVKEESTGVLSVNSDSVFWHMVSAIKQLKTELDTVKAELVTLKGN